MEETSKDLASLLFKQSKVQESLLAQEKRKTNILLKGSPEELNDILNAQQPFFMLSSNLEKQRESLQEKLKLDKTAMRRILEQAGTEEEKQLAEAFILLKKTVEELKKASNLNGRILQARIETKKNLMRIFGTENEKVTYSK